MNNDIGTIKAALPSAAQTGPSAPTGRPADVERTKDIPGAARQVDEASPESEPLDDVVSDLNNLVRELHRELRFSVDEESGETVIKVVDRETEEIVRQIPSEEVVQMRKRLEEAAGFIFQDSA